MKFSLVPHFHPDLQNTSNEEIFVLIANLQYITGPGLLFCPFPNAISKNERAVDLQILFEVHEQ